MKKQEKAFYAQTPVSVADCPIQDRGLAGKHVSHGDALAPGARADLHLLRGGQARLRPEGGGGKSGGPVGYLPGRGPLSGHPLRLCLLRQRFDSHGFFAAGMV